MTFDLWNVISCFSRSNEAALIEGTSIQFGDRKTLINFYWIHILDIFSNSQISKRRNLQNVIKFDIEFTYSKCPNSIQLVVFCSLAISENTCGPQRPLYHPSFYCISLSPSLLLSLLDIETCNRNTSSEMLTCPITFDRNACFNRCSPVSRNEKVFRQLGATPGPFSPKASMLAKQPWWIHKQEEKKT